MNYNSDENPFKVDAKGVKTGERVIEVFGYLIYLAGALFATMAFYKEVDTLFRDSTPILATLATIGAWANFASVAVMWWAKKYWIADGAMMTVAVIGWVIEILMMCANTLAAYGSTWTMGWIQVSPVTPVYVIALWGLLAFLHPSHKARQQLVNFHAKQQKTFLNMLDTAMQSEEVQNTMLDGAQQAARDFANNTLGVRIGRTNTDAFDKRQSDTNQPPAERDTNQRKRPIFFSPRVSRPAQSYNVESDTNFTNARQKNGRKPQ